MRFFFSLIVLCGVIDYYVPVTTLNILHILSHLIFIIYFTDRELHTKIPHIKMFSNFLLKKKPKEKWGHEIGLGKKMKFIV